MVEDHDIKENQWIINAYQVKQKWAACYMKRAFTLGVRSTQLSESLNSDFKDLLNLSVDLVQFFKLFEKIVEEKRYNELKCEYASREKMPRLRNSMSLMLKQLSERYTPIVFEMFQQEFDAKEQTCIKGKDEGQVPRRYVISLVGDDRDYIVLLDLLDNTITCSCCKFESTGILCCHALKVYDLNDIKLLPDRYIISRWTNKARASVVNDATWKEIEEEPRLQTTQWYNELTRKSLNVSTEACRSAEGRSRMLYVLDNLHKELIELHSARNGSDTNLNADVKAPAVPLPQCTPSATRFKQRDGANNKKRHCNTRKF